MAVAFERARLVAAAAALTVVLGAHTQSLCFMPASGRSGTGAHDCCKTGLSARPPACCLLSRAPAEQARLPQPVDAYVPLARAGAVPPLESPVSSATVTCAAPLASHSPPLTALRI